LRDVGAVTVGCIRCLLDVQIGWLKPSFHRRRAGCNWNIKIRG
jgi:hypothetical protein